MQQKPDELFAALEASGEEAVRRKYAQNAYGTDKRPLVELWLQQKDGQRQALTTGDAAARDRARLELAAQANEIARGSAKTARRALCVSVASVLLALAAFLFAIFR